MTAAPAAASTPEALTAILAQLRYTADGLIPAIAQQHDTGEVLMLAWMNRASIEETLQTGQVCYWSRSRQSFWRKGETSGQHQTLVEMRLDCDLDTLLLRVDQLGAACHTGRRDCFYRKVAGDKVIIDREPLVDPDTLYTH
ncbi:MAG: phosphoribosyl-AMP cyclohydrolase [Thiothrix sp.]|nr:phosphoribosyl-AMP cyclohydrolase [Thiothrix sp.]HPQ94220.1 phosphoribosyl-AMP cyclohydrolase [Thiolinea sp.]